MSISIVFNPFTQNFDFVGPAGGGGSGVNTLTGNNPVVVNPIGNNINIVGSGAVTVTGDNATATLAISISGDGFVWNTVPGPSATMVAQNGYISTDAALTTLTLPSVAVVGDTVKAIGIGAAGYIIAKGNNGDTILIGNTSTLAGAGHYIQFGQVGSSITLTAIIVGAGANTWAAIDAPQGPVTFV